MAGTKLTRTTLRIETRVLDDRTRLSLREVEDLYIEEVMRLTSGNKVQAARILGIDRKTLYRRAERSVRRGGQEDGR